MFTIKSPYVVQALIFAHFSEDCWDYIAAAEDVNGTLFGVGDYVVENAPFRRIVKVLFDDGDQRFYMTEKDSYSSWIGNLWSELREVRPEPTSAVVYKEV